jgi:hypothetical protein
MALRIDATSTSLAGLQLAQSRLGDDAERIASDPTDVSSIVDLSVEKAAFAANATVLRVEDETEQHLIDVLA